MRSGNKKVRTNKFIYNLSINHLDNKNSPLTDIIFNDNTTEIKELF